MFQARYEVQKKTPGSFYFTHMLFFENDEKLGTESFQQFCHNETREFIDRITP